jgi:hypothetical protein
VDVADDDQWIGKFQKDLFGGKNLRDTMANTADAGRREMREDKGVLGSGSHDVNSKSRLESAQERGES